MHVKQHKTIAKSQQKVIEIFSVHWRVVMENDWSQMKRLRLSSRGVICYCVLLLQVQGNVLKDYSASDPKILVAQIAVLFAVMMSYPVMYFISR